LADDHELVRRLLRRAISAHPGLELVGEAADGSEAVELARELTPDVVVLDLAMPEKDGLQVAGELRTELPACAILVFSDQDAEQAALAAGADRYVGKADGFAAAAQAAAELAVRR
jgi:DNA-binding NarL/FixJ family response regulator